MEKRILLLADSASSHTEKWATALAAKGFKVGLFSLNKTAFDWYKNNKNIVLLSEPDEFRNANALSSKLRYLFVLPQLLRQIKAFNPHVLHAHYASSYGLLGALTKFRPFVISTWGSDVFEFPRKSFFHKAILKYNLSKADRILSTSYALKGELWHYTKKDVQVIPFGVNTEMFYPENAKSSGDAGTIHIGTVKSLEDIYGIQTIVEAMQHIKAELPQVAVKFFFVGGGGRLEHYRQLTNKLGLGNSVEFTGKVPFSQVPYYHNLLDIFLNVSIVDESFGVSVIEAMACEKPVIVTNAPGLKEIVNSPELGVVVEKANSTQLAEAIIDLILWPEKRLAMGKAGRRHVLHNYDFTTSLEQMADLYNTFLKERTQPAAAYGSYAARAKEPAI